MGNFFSQYDPAKHSCTPGANGASSGQTQLVKPPSERARKSTRLFRRTFQASSNNDKKNGRNTSRIPHSETADKRRAGFLDLPAELRNNIYSRVLICDGYVRLTHEQPTKVPALVLLRVCKQVHDEAASVFYAANSFYCHIEKYAQLGPQAKLSLPKISQGDHYIWNDSRLLDTGGVFFPAPRYHLWVTRITIDTRVVLPAPPREFKKDLGLTTRMERDREFEALSNVQGEITRSFEATFQKMKELWEEKGSKWHGTMVGSQDNWSPKLLYFSISFHEDEEDEVATKRAWRNWS